MMLTTKTLLSVDLSLLSMKQMFFPLNTPPSVMICVASISQNVVYWSDHPILQIEHLHSNVVNFVCLHRTVEVKNI